MFEQFPYRSVAAGKYNFTIDEAATQAVYNDPLGAAVTTPSYVDDNGDTAADLDAIPDDAGRCCRDQWP